MKSALEATSWRQSRPPLLAVRALGQRGDCWLGWPGQARGDGAVSEAQARRKEAPTWAPVPGRVLLLSWADVKTRKPALEPVCPGSTLAACHPPWAFRQAATSQASAASRTAG